MNPATINNVAGFFIQPNFAEKQGQWGIAALDGCGTLSSQTWLLTETKRAARGCHGCPLTGTKKAAKNSQR